MTKMCLSAVDAVGVFSEGRPELACAPAEGLSHLRGLRVSCAASSQRARRPVALQHLVRRHESSYLTRGRVLRLL